MVWLALLLAMISFTVCFYFVLQGFNKALRLYEEQFKGLAQRNLKEVFLFIDPVQVWTSAFLFCLFSMALMWLFTQSWYLSMGLGFLFLMLPTYLIKRFKKRRLQLFDKQLPDMLLSLSSALRSGSGVQNALKLFAEESQAPLSQELGLLVREQRLGLSFEQALDNLNVRMPSESTQLMVSSLKIAQQTGGNLADALERIAATLRSSLQIQGRIKALTSQGKMQAWVMSVLPLFLLLVLNYLDAEAMQYLWNSWVGWSVLGLILFLEGLGMWMIRKIVTIDV